VLGDPLVPPIVNNIVSPNGKIEKPGMTLNDKDLRIGATNAD